MKQVKKPKLKYIMYARAATEEASQSIEYQKKELSKMGRDQKLKIIDTISEVGSAISSRPGFDKIMDEIEHGDANSILTMDLSRLTRNVYDAARLIFAMGQKKLVEIRTPNKTYLNNPDDQFLFQIQTGLAMHESDLRSMRIKHGLKLKQLKQQKHGKIKNN